MRMEKLNSPWPTRLIALLFAVLLFTFVKSKNNSQMSSTNPTNGASITSVEVVTDIPISIDVDRDKFFVSGLPETATIRLEGSQSILTQTLATRTFEVTTPNLNDLGTGTHVIQLEAKKLSNSLTYSIMPSEVSITIEERAVIDHPISVEFSASSLAEGYTAETPIVSPESVTISGAKSTIEKISEVSVLVLPEGSNITDDIDMTLPVLVFDKNGELLNVNVSPSQVAVTIPVKGTTRKIPIVLRQTGESHPDYTYELELAEGEKGNVTVTGKEELLNSLENFPIEIDISGVTESTTRKVKLSGSTGVTVVQPEFIEVVIRVKRKAEDSTENGDTTSEGASSENSSDPDSTEESEETSTDETNSDQ